MPRRRAQSGLLPTKPIPATIPATILPTMCHHLSPPRVLAALAAVVGLAAAGVPQNGATYRGWGTYYGTPPMPPNTHVHCHLPNMGGGSFGYAGVQRTIAINADQWAGSQACGTCAEVWGNGRLCDHGVQGHDCGLGQQHNAFKDKFTAVVTDELWEKGYGDIDVGVWGDGRYPVQWKIIPCPWGGDRVRIKLHQGGSKYYIKIQFRYMDSGMKWVKNEGTGEVSQYRFHDNHFVFESRQGIKGWHDHQLSFRAESNLGTQYCGRIDHHFRADPYEYHAWLC